MRLFNLSKKSSSDDPYWEFDESNHFRPIISKEDFEMQSGFDLGWLIVEPLSDMIRKKDHEIDRGRRLSYGQKALYYWWYIDAEVTNGGFVQFYYNGCEQYVPTIIKGLEYINDTEMAELIRKADALYQKRKRVFDKAHDEDGFGDRLYNQLSDFFALDEQYQALNKQTMVKMEAYIRQHPEEFCMHS